MIKKDAMEHHVSRQHPEKHISKLRQDWQQKKKKANLEKLEPGALYGSSPPPDTQVLLGPGSCQACRNGVWLTLSRTKGFY